MFLRLSMTKKTTDQREEENCIDKNSCKTEKAKDNNVYDLDRTEIEINCNDQGNSNVDVYLIVCGIVRKKTDTISTNNRDDKVLIRTGKK